MSLMISNTKVKERLNLLRFFDKKRTKNGYKRNYHGLAQRIGQSKTNFWT